MSVLAIGDASFARRRRAHPKPANIENEKNTESIAPADHQESLSVIVAERRSIWMTIRMRMQKAKRPHESCSCSFIEAPESGLTPELSRAAQRLGGVVHDTAQAEPRSGLGLNE